jgi:RimJ/RimL family protein N-acetyltransferase
MAVIASGCDIILRDRLSSDVDAFIRWRTQGEWRLLDAPWQGVRTSLTPEEEARLREQSSAYRAEQTSPRKMAIIAMKEGRPLGWVNRYSEPHSSDTLMVGIDICEDDALNRGFGTEALGLWIGHLFSDSGVHRLGFDTWSFNPRAMRVADKAGFVHEGTQREVLQWEGKWLDLVHFGMLRTEWEARRETSQ